MSHRPDFHEREDITFIVTALMLRGLEEDKFEAGSLFPQQTLSELYDFASYHQSLKANA